MVSGQDDSSISVPAFGSETIELPMRLSYFGLIESLPEILRTGNADYTVKGSIKTSIFSTNIYIKDVEMLTFPKLTNSRASFHNP